MAIATPSPAMMRVLNEHLNITRDAAVANLRTQSEETRQQYRDEAAKIADQKERSAEVVQGTIDAARDNAALRSEAEYNQAFKNFQAVEDLAMRTSAANPRETRLPLELHRQVVESTHKFLSAQSDYVTTHPERRRTIRHYNIRLAEDGNGGFQLVNGLDPGLAEQRAIASPDRNQRQVNPNEPLAHSLTSQTEVSTWYCRPAKLSKVSRALRIEKRVRHLGESKVQNPAPL